MKTNTTMAMILLLLLAAACGDESRTADVVGKVGTREITRVPSSRPSYYTR